MKKKVNILVMHKYYGVCEENGDFLEICVGNEKNFHRIMDKYEVVNKNSFKWSKTKKKQIINREKI